MVIEGKSSKNSQCLITEQVFSFFKYITSKKRAIYSKRCTCAF